MNTLFFPDFALPFFGERVRYTGSSSAQKKDHRDGGGGGTQEEVRGWGTSLKDEARITYTVVRLPPTCAIARVQSRRIVSCGHWQCERV